MARIVRTRQAREDVIDIWEYIARDNSTAADKLLRKFDETMQHLSEHPRIGAPQDKYRRGLRCFPVGRYLIFYESFDGGIRIIRVLHGRRNWPEFLADN
jgi:toxin ParE1/3/4